MNDMSTLKKYMSTCDHFGNQRGMGKKVGWFPPSLGGENFPTC